MVYRLKRIGGLVLYIHCLEACPEFHQLLYSLAVSVGSDTCSEFSRVCSGKTEIVCEHLRKLLLLRLRSFLQLCVQLVVGLEDVEDQLIRLTATLTIVVFLLVVEVAVAITLAGQLLQLRFGRFEDAPAEVGKLLVVVFQPEHLTELQCLDDGPTLLQPRLYIHIYTLRIAVLACEDDLLSELMVSESVHRHQPLSHATVQLQDSVFIICMVIGNIYIAEVGRLGIFSSLRGLIGNFYWDRRQHFQRVAQLRIVVRVHAQLFEWQLHRQTSVLVELCCCKETQLLIALVIEDAVEDTLKILHHADKNPYLYKRVVVTHHRHGNRLHEPCLVLNRYKVGRQAALNRFLLCLRTAFLRLRGGCRLCFCLLCCHCSFYRFYFCFGGKGSNKLFELKTIATKKY